jgi:hypothetical protein
VVRRFIVYRHYKLIIRFPPPSHLFQPPSTHSLPLFS